MYHLFNKERQELLTLLPQLIEREKYIPDKSIKDANVSRKARQILKKLEKKEPITNKK